MRATLALLLLSGLTFRSEARLKNKISPRAAKALSAPTSVVLYSLDPAVGPDGSGPKLHTFKILGKATLDGKQTATALKAFNAAVSSGDASFFYNCFDPRQALRIVADNHTYDFLLCYKCHRLYVYEGEKVIETLGAGGSPEALKALLKDLRLPLAKTPDRP